jgi:hypothetical protein
LLAHWLGAVLAIGLPMPGWLPLGMGAASAAVLLFGFAFPPLLQLARVPTLRVLRRRRCRLSGAAWAGLAVPATLAARLASSHGWPIARAAGSATARPTSRQHFFDRPPSPICAGWLATAARCTGKATADAPVGTASRQLPASQPAGIRNCSHGAPGWMRLPARSALPDGRLSGWSAESFSWRSPAATASPAWF